MLEFTLLAIGMATAFAEPAKTYSVGFDRPQSVVSQRQEDYQDWRVSCVETDGETRCILQQQLLNMKTNQSILSLELEMPSDGSGEGTIIMPLGMAVDRDSSLQIDDAEDLRRLKIETCVPAGCISHFEIDTDFMRAMRRARTLKVQLYSATAEGRRVTFPLSLEGFPQALDRSTALTAHIDTDRQ